MRIKTHPGAVLREEYLKPLGVSAETLAMRMRVPEYEIVELVAEQRDIDEPLANRLSMYYGTTPEFWINLQASYDESKGS